MSRRRAIESGLIRVVNSHLIIPSARITTSTAGRKVDVGQFKLKGGGKSRGPSP